jgi:hypothetical protein
MKMEKFYHNKIKIILRVRETDNYIYDILLHRKEKVIKSDICCL